MLEIKIAAAKQRFLMHYYFGQRFGLDCNSVVAKLIKTAAQTAKRVIKNIAVLMTSFKSVRSIYQKLIKFHAMNTNRAN